MTWFALPILFSLCERWSILTRSLPPVKLLKTSIPGAVAAISRAFFNSAISTPSSIILLAKVAFLVGDNRRAAGLILIFATAWPWLNTSAPGFKQERDRAGLVELTLFRAGSIIMLSSARLKLPVGSGGGNSPGSIKINSLPGFKIPGTYPGDPGRKAVAHSEEISAASAIFIKRKELPTSKIRLLKSLAVLRVAEAGSSLINEIAWWAVLIFCSVKAREIFSKARLKLGLFLL